VPGAEKVWESVPKVQKVWESVPKPEKVCESVLKLEKGGESIRMSGKCYLFAVQMLIIFDVQYKTMLPFLGCVCLEVSLRTECCCQKS
jgi:hypothetical protein